MKPLALLLSSLLLGASATGAQAADAAPAAKPDIAKGQAISNNVCVSCHANDGSRGSPANPIIQAQHPAYIAKQLANYKAGDRKNPIMQGIAATLSPEDMKNVAAFYATKSYKPGFAKNKEFAQLGERIYRGGIAERSIPACAGCHAPNGAGIPAEYPRLGGQHADYTEAQLVAFRAGQRTNSLQMTQIAAKMNDREIKAVSDYLAGLR